MCTLCYKSLLHDYVPPVLKRALFYRGFGGVGRTARAVLVAARGVVDAQGAGPRELLEGRSGRHLRAGAKARARFGLRCSQK